MPRAMKVLTHSAEETRILGAALAPLLLPGDVISLSGDLGAGKTCFVQGLATALGAPGRVTSPSFTIVHEYSGARSKVYHLDLYRLGQTRELETLGWDDMLQEMALVIVEWPDRAPDLMPHGHVPISLSHIEGRPDHRILYAGGHT